ncbi:MAG: hypothetical protein QOJ29_310, partial [Thermoleophilaceae bacterium]|nr:hypothetical protein [Thermoleophilaceae bacterium]
RAAARDWLICETLFWHAVSTRRARLEADGGGLENRYGAEASSWVRIPRPPLEPLTCTAHVTT